MKTLLALTLALGMVGTANALPLIPFVITGMVEVIHHDTVDDKRLFKTVTASWADNKDGYSFDITQFEYDNNKSKYVLK